VVNEPLCPAYFETRLRVERAVPQWPAEFVILNACATTGEVWPPEREAEADRKLEAHLRQCSGWLLRIVGVSPDGKHVEPSWAVTLPLDEARRIGVLFKQDALYLVRDGFLRVTRCAEGSPLVDVAPFRERLEQPAR